MATTLMAFELLCLKSVPMKRVYVFAESHEVANSLAIEAGYSSFLLEQAESLSCLIQADYSVISSAKPTTA